MYSTTEYDIKNIKAQNDLKAHEETFKFIVTYIQNSIVNDSNVENMSMLREKYLAHMQEHYPDSYNKNYKTDKLKDKLIKHFGDQIQFWSPNYKSDIVYSSDVKTGKAVQVAFDMSTSQRRTVQQVGALLRRHILDENEKANDLPWPPPRDLDCEIGWSKVPSLVETFFESVLSNDPTHLTERQSRLVKSLSQDLSFNVSRGLQVLPKHVSLGILLLHETGSAEMVTVVNRLGHCASYSRIIEILSAIYTAIKENDEILPEHIDAFNNLISLLCFDNFDHLEETRSGSGTTHITNGIMCQEKKDPLAPSQLRTHACVPKTKKKAVKYSFTKLPPCYINDKAPPNLRVDKQIVPYEASLKSSQQSDILWVICRFSKSEAQTLPAYSGWISETGARGVEPLSVVAYLPPIMEPITENCTIKECLDQAKKLSDAVKQQYAYVFFDMNAAKKAYVVCWNYPTMYKSVIIMPGDFHLISNACGCLGKIVTGSGFEEVVLDSGICASGSLTGVLSGMKPR